MHLHLDHHSGEPIYRQLVEQIKYRIACGSLVVGEQLPSIRSLALDLSINPRTVVKAYEELRHAGLLVMRPGQGVFIRSTSNDVPASARRKAIEEMARRLLAEAASLGADPEEVIDIIAAVSRRMEKVK